MKKILLALLCAATSVTAQAQTDVWYWKNNHAVKIASVDSITFTAPLDMSNGYAYVDLGLSVRWATANVGAEHPYDYGLYFAWGETTGFTSDTSDGRSFRWSDYKWCNGSYNTLTKYNNDTSNGTVDNKTVLDPEDDAAAVNMGGAWRMPTKAELDELRTLCTWAWQEAGNTAYNGVAGYKVTGSNGNSIFLPATGFRRGESFDYAGTRGYYWSASLIESSPGYAYSLHFGSDYAYCSYFYRYDGYTVRAVLPE